MFNPNILVELQKDIATIRKEVTQSIQIAKECSEKVDKQNDATLLDRLCNIRLYLIIAVLIIAILIALLLQSPHGMGEDQIQQKFIELQQQTTLLQGMLNETVENQQHHYYRLDNSVWSVKLLLLSEVLNGVAPVTMKMSSLTERVRNYQKW